MVQTQLMLQWEGLSCYTSSRLCCHGICSEDDGRQFNGGVKKEG